MTRRALARGRTPRRRTRKINFCNVLMGYALFRYSMNGAGGPMYGRKEQTGPTLLN